MGKLEKAEISALPNTGERMIPETTARSVFWEHIYRYRFATQFARGKRILDIACGEGYGSAALLKAGAASLIGVDVSPEVCEHARQKYGVDARVGDAQNIPLPDDSIDLIVSFETIEHVSDPGRFLDECVRVLAPGGALVISTPNRGPYLELTPGGSNPFHCLEMDLREFEDLLRPRFRRWSNYTQFPRRARWYQPAGLAVRSWFWWRLPGIRDLYWRLWWRTCRHIDRDPTAEERHSPQDAILRREPPLANLFNIVAVHPSPWFAGEDPVYLIAVANVD